MSKLRAAILVVSETASRDASTDKCIPILQETFSRLGGDKWDASETKIVSDDILQIQRAVTGWCDGENFANVVVTSGGTGFTGKDVTPEAVMPLIHKHAPGLVHAMISSSLQVTPFAMMARPVAGVRNRTLILTLPGSPKGAKENLEAVIHQLAHACQQAAGADSRALHVGGTQKLEQEAGIAKPQGTSVGASHHHHHHHHGHGSHKVPRAHTKPEDRPALSNDPSAGPTRRYRESPYPMLSVEEALSLIASETPEPKATKADLDQSLVGAVLAQDVKAPESVPAFRASIVDGYAILAKDHPMVPSTKGIFPVVSVSHAQAGKDMEKLEIGEVARITTGAPLPPGATAVVMVEDTVLKTLTEDKEEEHEIEILTDEVKEGENVREIGSDVKAGDIVINAGEGITSIGGEYGLLASVGVRDLEIYQRPIVGVLSTGDEIIPHDRPGDLRLGEVRDTNRPTLLTAIRNSGFEALDLGIASDAPGSLEVTLRDALKKVDVLVTSGGVSMGELDLLKPTIERSLGGTIHFGRVSMKPGKPTTFATVPVKSSSSTSSDRQKKVIFSLPGNPASAVVTYHLFVLPSLQKLAGYRQPWGLPRVKAVLEKEVRCDAKRSEYHRVVVQAREDGRLWAVSTGFQRSSRIGSFKGANALLSLPAKEGVVGKGEMCEALMMGPVVGMM